jgi:hypothetical protein
MIELDVTQHDALTCEATQVVLAGPRGTGKSSVLAERAIWLILECDVPPESIAIVVASPHQEAEMREIAEKPLKKMQYRVLPALMTMAAFKKAACVYAHVLIDDAQDGDDDLRKAVAVHAAAGAVVFATVRTAGESAVSEAERSATEEALSSFPSATRFDLVWIYRKHDAKRSRGQSSGEEQMSLF